MVDADQISRDVTTPGSSCLNELLGSFGDTILTQQGSLNRVVLGTIVFSNPEKRKLLESIIHPYIIAESEKTIRSFDPLLYPFVIYEAALLVETKRYKELDILIVVSSSSSTQSKRLLSHGMSKEEATLRIKSQMSLAEKIAVADYVIDNDKDTLHLEAQVDNLYAQLVKRFNS